MTASVFRDFRALALAGACALVAWSGQARADTQRLVILHDNDIHGHLREFCYIEKAKGPDEHCQIGGSARRMTLIRALKAKAAGAPVLLIDSGDTTTRGPLATEYEGVDEIAAMNAIGYDIAAIGNNEFKLKDAADINDAAGAQEALERLIRLSDFPWLCANATDPSGALLPGVQPFVVRQIGPLKVAFLGLTTQRAGAYPQTKGWVIGDPIAAAKVWIPRARAEADIVIAVTHLGVFDDQRLAHETKGLDAIVGGDSHTYLYQPLLQKNLDGADVPIVQDGEFGVRLGEFDLTFEGDAKTGWKLAHFTDELIAVDAASKPDPAIAALVERFAHPLDTPVGKVARIGATPAERSALTAEGLAQAWKMAVGTDVGMQAEGDLFESFRSREVTRYDVHAIMPFHDTVWRGQVTGEKLKALVDKPALGVGTVHLTLPEAEIDPAKTYTVATNTFEAVFLGAAVDTGEDVRKAMEAWLSGGPATH